MKTPLETRLLATSTRVKSLADNAFKHPISSILSLCLIAGIAATIATFSQTTQAPVQPTASLPVARTITDTKGRSMAGTILSKSDTAIKFRRTLDNKKFEIKLETLSPEDNAFVATIAGQTAGNPAAPAPDPAKTTVLFLVNYGFKYPTYSETLTWLRKNNYNVTVGMTREGNYQLDAHLRMAEVPPEEKQLIIINSGADTDPYDILWIRRFSSSYIKGSPSFFDICNYRDKTKKTVVLSCVETMANKKRYLSEEARKLSGRRNYKKSETFIRKVDNWVFYETERNEKTGIKLLKTVDRAVAEASQKRNW